MPISHIFMRLAGIDPHAPKPPRPPQWCPHTLNYDIPHRGEIVRCYVSWYDRKDGQWLCLPLDGRNQCLSVPSSVLRQLAPVGPEDDDYCPVPYLVPDSPYPHRSRRMTLKEYREWKGIQ